MKKILRQKIFKEAFKFNNSSTQNLLDPTLSIWDFV